jgi:hypothetical protein
MSDDAIKRSAAKFSLFSGVLAILVSGMLLFSSYPLRWWMAVPVAILPIFQGASLLFIALKLHRKARYVFMAAFLVQSGFLFLIKGLGLLPYTILQVWPLFAIFSSLALLPTSFLHYGRLTVRYLVPSIGFFVMGLLFLLFSMHVLQHSFRDFFILWWPLALVLSLVSLVLVSFCSKQGKMDSSR